MMLHHWSDENLGVPLYLPTGTTALLDANEDGDLQIFLKTQNQPSAREALAKALEATAAELRKPR